MRHLLEVNLLMARPVTLSEARETYARHLSAHGYASTPKLLAVDTNAKCALDKRVVIATLTLSPFATGDISTCPAATDACAAACVLGHARGSWESVIAGRAMRTTFADQYPGAFLAILGHELRTLARRHRSRLRVRLNVASDVRWERVAGDMMREVHGIATAHVRRYREAAPTFYDYTKLGMSTRDGLDGAYRVVYSVSERVGTLKLGARYIDQGGSAAVVLDVRKGDPLPTVWNGRPMIDGDTTDDRTGDPRGVWVGLRAKGDAKGDTSGFVYAPA